MVLIDPELPVANDGFGAANAARPRVLCLAFLGCKEPVELCLCFVDSVYVTFGIDKCSLSLGSHPFQL